MKIRNLQSEISLQIKNNEHVLQLPKNINIILYHNLFTINDMGAIKRQHHASSTVLL
jgi:hypothetical protein